MHRKLTMPARRGKPVRHPGHPHQLRRMTMEIQAQTMASMPRREPWNKGKLIGQKPPLRPKHVSSIRTRLQMEGRTRDLAMFNLAIDSKLRACDLVRLQVHDICVSGQVRGRTTVIQRKTGQPVQFEISEPTRASIRDWLPNVDTRHGRYLFPSLFRAQPHLSTRQYARSCRRGSRALGSIARPMVPTRCDGRRPPRFTRKRAT